MSEKQPGTEEKVKTQTEGRGWGGEGEREEGGGGKEGGDSRKREKGRDGRRCQEIWPRPVSVVAAAAL